MKHIMLALAIATAVTAPASAQGYYPQERFPGPERGYQERGYKPPEAGYGQAPQSREEWREQRRAQRRADEQDRIEDAARHEAERIDQEREERRARRRMERGW